MTKFKPLLLPPNFCSSNIYVMCDFHSLLFSPNIYIPPFVLRYTFVAVILFQEAHGIYVRRDVEGGGVRAVFLKG